MNLSSKHLCVKTWNYQGKSSVFLQTEIGEGKYLAESNVPQVGLFFFCFSKKTGGLW